MTDSFDETVGTNIAQRRATAGMSQTDLAEALSRTTGERIHQQTILKIEKGTRPLKFSEAQRIADVFHVPVTALLTDQSLGDTQLSGKVISAMLSRRELHNLVPKMAEALVQLAVAVGADKARDPADQASPSLTAQAQTELATQWGDYLSELLLNAVVNHRGHGFSDALKSARVADVPEALARMVELTVEQCDEVPAS